MSKGLLQLGGNMAVETKTLLVTKGFPNVTTSGHQYNIEEKPSVILYTYINHHAGIPKPQSRDTVSLGVQYILTKESRTTVAWS